MHNFVFNLPTRVAFGPGVVSEAGRESRVLGSRALLVTGTTFARKSGLIDTVVTTLEGAGLETGVFDRLGPNPSWEKVEEGGAAARQRGADVIVGLGGGSTLDAAKMIAAVAADRDAVRGALTEGHGRTISAALPIVQVPLIASTGSETNQTAIILDESSGRKIPISSPHLQARVAVVDPILTFTVPPQYTTVGAVNIASQMLESYLTNEEFTVSDRLTEGLLRVVMDSLPRALRRSEDLDAHSNLSWAAVVASSVAVAGREGSRPLQAMAHPLTARYGIDHGLAVSALWNSFMRYALSNRLRLPQIGRFKRYALLGRQIFGVHETDDEVAAETTAYRLRAWLRGLDMPTDLGGLNLGEIDSATLADEAMVVSGRHGRLAGGLSREDIEHIYEGAARSTVRV